MWVIYCNKYMSDSRINVCPMASPSIINTWPDFIDRFLIIWILCHDRYSLRYLISILLTFKIDSRNESVLVKIRDIAKNFAAISTQCIGIGSHRQLNKFYFFTAGILKDVVGRDTLFLSIFWVKQILVFYRWKTALGSKSWICPVANTECNQFGEGEHLCSYHPTGI